MGSIVSTSSSSSSNDPTTVDPATGLTARQKKLVQSSWALVKKDPVANGVAIMTTYFQKHPDYQLMFSQFKDLSLEELAANKKFQAHCLSIVTTLGNVIDSLNDPGLLEASLVAIGERHNRRGQTKQHFVDLKVVVVEVLRQKLGPKFTAETEEAWSKTIDAAYAGIFQALET